MGGQGLRFIFSEFHDFLLAAECYAPTFPPVLWVSPTLYLPSACSSHLYALSSVGSQIVLGIIPNPLRRNTRTSTVRHTSKTNFEYLSLLLHLNEREKTAGAAADIQERCSFGILVRQRSADPHDGPPVHGVAHTPHLHTDDFFGSRVRRSWFPLRGQGRVRRRCISCITSCRHDLDAFLCVSFHLFMFLSGAGTLCEHRVISTFSLHRVVLFRFLLPAFRYSQ